MNETKQFILITYQSLIIMTNVKSTLTNCLIYPKSTTGEMECKVNDVWLTQKAFYYFYGVDMNSVSSKSKDFNTWRCRMISKRTEEKWEKISLWPTLQSQRHRQTDTYVWMYLSIYIIQICAYISIYGGVYKFKQISASERLSNSELQIVHEHKYLRFTIASCI